MHSTLAMTAGIWQAEHPTLQDSIRTEGIKQKVEAMREIRSRLTHAGSVRNHDEVAFLMTSMSTLVIAEVGTSYHSW
jgi:hypothetical protein